MSGDNRFVDYNEPESMRQFALSLGVPDRAIVLDYAGRRTYDTCYRAKAIFGVENACWSPRVPSSAPSSLQHARAGYIGRGSDSIAYFRNGSSVHMEHP